MNFPSSLIKNTVEAISNFPGIGKKTALRLAIYLLRNKRQAYNMSDSIKKMIDETMYCISCNNISKNELCDICINEVLYAFELFKKGKSLNDIILAIDRKFYRPYRPRRI